MDERMRTCQSNVNSAFKWINSGLPAMGILSARTTMHIYPADGEMESPSLLISSSCRLPDHLLVATIEWLPFASKKNHLSDIVFNIIFQVGNLCVWNNNCIVPPFVQSMFLLFVQIQFTAFLCFRRLPRAFFLHTIRSDSFVCLAAKNAFSWMHHLWAD